MEKQIEIEAKDNFFAIPVDEADIIKIMLNEQIATELVIPYDGKLKCYLSSEKPPITYKKK